VEDGEEIETNMFSSALAGLRKKTSLPLPLTSIQSSGRSSLYPSMVSLNGLYPGGGRSNAHAGLVDHSDDVASRTALAPNKRRDCLRVERAGAAGSCDRGSVGSARRVTCDRRDRGDCSRVPGETARETPPTPTTPARTQLAM
jgi:hypothetical protein